MIKKQKNTENLMVEIGKMKKMNCATVHNCTFPYKIAEYNFLQVQRMYHCDNQEDGCFVYEFIPNRKKTCEEMKYIIERILEVTYFRPFQSLYAFKENGNALILFNNVSMDGRKFRDTQLYQIADMFDAA